MRCLGILLSKLIHQLYIARMNNIVLVRSKELIDFSSVVVHWVPNKDIGLAFVFQLALDRVC